MSEFENLVEVKHLKEYFPINTGMFKTTPLKAVDDVSFAIRKGETLGLVGESGCGKTTVGRTLLHLYKPTAGEIWFNGKQIVTKQDIIDYRKKSAMVFQDPYSSLNPRMTVSDIIAEPLDVHKLYSSKVERQEKVLELIRRKAAEVYPNIEVVTYSPPYKPVFTDEDNRAIVEAINEANPDLLWIGMTAPKQEKWTYSHWNELNIHCHVGTIGAVFDFFAGTYKRAPQWWQDHSLEWLYRLLKEPKRMWRRYVLGNPLFLWNITLEAIGIR